MLMLIMVTTASTNLTAMATKQFGKNMNSAVNRASSAVSNAVQQNIANPIENNIANPIENNVVKPMERTGESLIEHGKEAIKTAETTIDTTGKIIKALPTIIRELSEIMKDLQNIINAGMASAQATSSAMTPLTKEMSQSIGKLQETISRLA